MCNQYNVTFNLKDFGIRQNKMDQFRGEKIAILYDPGMFPAIVIDKTGKLQVHFIAKQNYSKLSVKDAYF